MFHMKNFLFAGLAILLVSGCATANPRIIAASDQGITYRVKADNQEAARKAAEEYCGKRNRDAQLRSVTAAAGDRSIISFACT